MGGQIIRGRDTVYLTWLLGPNSSQTVILRPPSPECVHEFAEGGACPTFKKLMGAVGNGAGEVVVLVGRTLHDKSVEGFEER